MKYKVLIIDDDPDIRDVMATVLEANGYEVLQAADGDEGFDKAKAESPDIILLDVMMNSQDEGFQTAYRFRSDQDLGDVPIVMITSVSQVSGFQFDRDKDQDFLPVQDFIEKPISPDKLIDVVRKYLGK